jgi:hypothetical protein
MSESNSFGNTDDAVAFVLSGAPRLATVTNLAAISFSFLEGAKQALSVIIGNASDEVREVGDDYCIACEHMTVVRVHALLDRDDRTVSYQTVHKRLMFPEAVEALVRRMCDDPFQSRNIEDDVRGAISQFCRVYGTINWELHGRLSNFRNQGIAHLGRRRPSQLVSHDELRGLVRLVQDLADCLSPFRSNVPPVRDEEITERVKRATMIWQRALLAGSR